MAESSAAEPGRRKSPGRPFKPGESGNPGGLPKGVAEIRRGLLEFRTQAVKKLREFVEHGDDETCMEALKLYFKHVLPPLKEPEEDPVAAMSDEELEKRLREVMGRRHPSTKVTQ